MNLVTTFFSPGQKRFEINEILVDSIIEKPNRFPGIIISEVKSITIVIIDQAKAFVIGIRYCEKEPLKAIIELKVKGVKIYVVYLVEFFQLLCHNSVFT